VKPTEQTVQLTDLQRLTLPRHSVTLLRLTTSPPSRAPSGR
jgi:hypothetical protein